MTLASHIHTCSQEEYLDALSTALTRARTANAATLPAAAAIVADVVAADGIVYVFGSGHSQLVALELSQRAGGLAPLQVVFDPGWGRAEHVEGYGGTLIADVAFSAKDCLIAISNSGTTPAALEIAARARWSGTRVISVSSGVAAHLARGTHSAARNLRELADVAIDTAIPAGDAAICVPGRPDPIGPTSTLVAAALLHDVVVRAVAGLADRGVDAPLFRANAAAGGREHNAELRRRYAGRVRVVP